MITLQKKKKDGARLPNSFHYKCASMREKKKNRIWASGGGVTRPDSKFHLSGKRNLNVATAVKMVSFKSKQKILEEFNLKYINLYVYNELWTSSQKDFPHSAFE
jgi:hypothetical protein